MEVETGVRSSINKHPDHYSLISTDYMQIINKEIKTCIWYLLFISIIKISHLMVGSKKLEFVDHLCQKTDQPFQTTNKKFFLISDFSDFNSYTTTVSYKL